MNAQEELIQRLALKRQRVLGPLSEEAYHELELAVRADPFRFVDDDEEAAFALVVQALDHMEAARRDDEFLDDERYLEERTRRLKVLGDTCRQACSLDKHCIDAQHLLLLSEDHMPDELLGLMLDLERQLAEQDGSIAVPAAGDAWADVFSRARLRLQAAIARGFLDTARYSLAVDRCKDLLAKAPLDALGARFTCVLAMARLEDEEGFEWLDAREGRHGNAWFHLGRALLMYKLGRMPAARRALRGYDQLCVGGAYVLLQPIYVDTYLLDRPAFPPSSFAEAMLAVHEADPIISDVPDFVNWTCAQPGFLKSAQTYCRQNGFEWRDWDRGQG